MEFRISGMREGVTSREIENLLNIGRTNARSMTLSYDGWGLLLNHDLVVVDRWPEAKAPPL